MLTQKSLRDYNIYVAIQSSGLSKMAKRQRMFLRIGGYENIHYIVNICFNFIFSLILIFFSIPFLFVVSIMIKLQDKGPILYKGYRLGLNKKPFKMYKFRTMVVDADRIIGDRILKSNRNLITPLGKYLRDTRLDELPQLFNILKGDMFIMGPRPIPPNLYESDCRQIKGYDKRFSVKPGLIGFSQLYTPYSTPKRIRSYIDNKLLHVHQSFILEIIVTFFTVFIVIKTVFGKLAKHIWNYIYKVKILHIYDENRSFERINSVNARVYIGAINDNKEIFTKKAEVVDINEEAFRINSNYKIDHDETIYKLEIEYFTGFFKKTKRTKSGKCYGKIYRESETKDVNYSYVIKYTPKTPLDHYFIHQYFLFESVVNHK